MPEEIFDVVNDRDEVIGQKSRSEIHRLKLNHRAVHVLVFNARGELFLQKRSMKKDCSSSPPVPRPATNSCGFIVARPKGRSRFIRRKSSAAPGWRRRR